MQDLRKVSKPTENNYKLWLNIGNEIIDQYRELYGLPSSNKDNSYKDRIRDSAKNFREMFALLEAKVNKEKLDKQWSTYRSIMIKAFKTLPGPAKDGFKNIIKTKEGLDDAYKTNQTDPERDLTGYQPETSSKSSQDLATWYDKLKDNPEFKKAKIPPPPKEKKNIPTWYDELKNNPEFKKGTIPDPYGQDDAERDLTGYQPEKAKAKRYKQDYVGGVPDEVSNVKTIDDPGREEGWYKKDKKRAQAQAKASSYSTGYGSGDQQYAKGQVKVKWNGTDVPQLSKDNWQDWIKLGNELLSRYNESVTYSNNFTIAESIRFSLSKLFEKKEMSDQDKANWEVLQQQFSMFGKSLPPEAQKAYKDLQVKKRDYDISDIDSGPYDDGRDFSKDRYDAEQRSTYGDFYDIIQSVLKNTNLQTIQAAEQEIEKMNKEFRNLPVLHSTMKAQMYGSIAKRLGWKGIFNLDGKTVTFAETTPRKPNFFGDLSDMDKRLFMNGEHVTKDVAAVEKDADMQKIAYKQFRLGFLPNAVIPKFINKLNSADPNSEEKTATGGALPKVTLKGKMHLNKELPPLSSKTVEDYKKVYRKILRRYTAGTGKGRSYSKVPESSSANSIRQILNILSEAGAKMSSADLEDLTAIENAFKAAEKRKLITPQEVADFAPLISSKEQLTNQLKYDPKKQGNVPDTLKKAMAIQAPGSDTNYGVFNDQVMAVLNNPTPENLIKQAEAVSAMDLDGIDTDRMKFSAFYGHVANAMGLPGLITHRNSFMNSPMVVSAKARKTDFSDKMPEMLPFGEYSVEAVDFDNPRHKAVAQAQLNKNLLPASIQMSQNNTVDDVYKRFGITKQEPQEPERTGDVSPTVKSGERTKPSDLDTADELQGFQADPSDKPADDTGQTDRPSGDYNWNALPQAERPPTAQTNKYHYTRFVPLPKLYNKMLRLPASLNLFVDRVPRKADGLLGQQLSITDDPKTGKGIEVIHKNYKGKVYNQLLGWLQQQDLSLISKDEAEQFKKQAQHVSADWRGDPGEDRDLWDLLYGKDAKAKKQAAQDRRYAWNNPDGIDSSASFPPAEDNLPNKKTPTRQGPNYSDLEAPGPNQKTPTRQGPNYSDMEAPLPKGDAGGNTTERRFIAVPYTGPNQKTPNDHVVKDRQNPNYKSGIYPNRERAERAANGMEKMPDAYPTASDGAPAEVDPLNQEPNPATNTDLTSTGDVPERYKIEKITDASGKTQWKVYDSKNALGVSQIVDTEDEAKKVANQLNIQAAKNPVQNQGEFPVRQQDGKIAAAPERPNKKLDMDKIAAGLPSTAKDDYNKWERDQKAEKEKDQKNDNTDFTRLLKNAGLLKEFY